MLNPLPPRVPNSRVTAFLSPFAFAAALLVPSTGCTTSSAGAPGESIAAYIDTLSAIDVHAHPLRYVAAGTPPDSEYDALPLDGLPAFPMPVGVRADHPQFRAAQVALFGVSATDTGSTYASALSAARKRVMREQGERYSAWVLSKAHIDVMLANRVAMGAGLPSPAFRWVPFADALMLPLDGSGEATRTPDMRSLYPLETKLLKRYLRDLSLAGIPATLEAFESQVVIPTLEHQKASGAVGIKFEAAYLRTLDFGIDDEPAARSIYARYAKGGTPTHAEYLTLQNHLFRTITRTAGNSVSRYRFTHWRRSAATIRRRARRRINWKRCTTTPRCARPRS